jgi:cell envelope opacity-associated protein A
MVDVVATPDVSAEGHTVALSSYKGKSKPKVGDVVTVGPTDADAGQWEVLRIDEGESVMHLVRSDKVAALKKDHEKRGLRSDGSVKEG